jgi:alpha-mannosidase
MTAASPTTVYVVSHTHWDREWYRTFHEFRVDLVDVVAEVLDELEGDGAFRHFLLDGQSILLDDYLAIRPEDADRMRALARRGRLSLGPWYVLPDEFLVSAEATVRNLILGHRIATAVGPVQKVGYLPDSFGHIAQLPQILRLAGMDSFVYTRGNGAEIDELGLEYRWVGPDGSEVLAINQYRGYCNGGELGYHESWHARTDRVVDVPHAVRQVQELFEEMAERSRGDVYLLSNGCDHLPPQKDLGRILARLQEAYPDTEFKHASLADYVTAVADSGVATRSHSGELLGGRLQFILSGVWSARTYLKQRNELAQQMLADYTEPLCSYLHFVSGHPYPRGDIDYAWRLLLQNHPHDSICGCSVDQVHRDMISRFDGVVQTGEQLIRKRLEWLAPPVAREASGDDRVVICVANPLPETRTEVVERVVVLRGFDGSVDTLQLVDGEGREVPLRVLEAKRVRRSWGFDFTRELFGERQVEALATHFDNVPDATPDQHDCLVAIQFVAEGLPAVGHANFILTERESASAPPRLEGAVSVSGRTLENPFVRVSIRPNGVFDLYDKATDTEYKGLNRLEDTEDVGDEYDYSPCERSQTVFSDGVEGEVRIVEDTGLRAAVEVTFPLRLPEAVVPDRTARGSDTVDCPTRVRVGLACHRPVVEIDLFFDNRAKDHRLRARFPTPIRSDTIVSDGHFYVNHRPLEQASGDGWVQPPSGTYPQQEFSLVQDDRRGLVVLNRGLLEVAALRGDSGTIELALTVLRAVGWLSRDDFPTRRYKRAGPQLATPDAQCEGEHRFCYAVAPFGGDYIDANVKSLSRQYRTPVAVIQGVADRRVDGGSLVRNESVQTCVSAVKKHEIRDTLVVRLYNLTAEPVNDTLRFGRNITSAWLTDLLEERVTQVSAEGDRIALTFRPHEIVTVEVELEEISRA